MFWLAHFCVGLLIGKILGNYPVALVVSLGIDVDHMYSYAKGGILSNPRAFWSYVTNREGKQIARKDYFLHSVFSWLLLSGVFFFMDGYIGLVFFVSYFFHLLLDALDSSDMHPFYPFRFKIRGPVGYFSKTEFFITGVFLVGFLILLFL